MTPGKRPDSHVLFIMPVETNQFETSRLLLNSPGKSLTELTDYTEKNENSVISAVSARGKENYKFLSFQR